MADEVNCISCGGKSDVRETRDDGKQVRRQRKCDNCLVRWWTVEASLKKSLSGPDGAKCKPKRKLQQSQRFRILHRDKFTCQYCGASAPDAVLEVDHKIPFSKGGTDDPSNLITSCNKCNGGKGAHVT